MAGTKDRVTIELYVDDQGVVRIRDAKVAVQEMGQAGQKAMTDNRAAADDFTSALTRQIGAITALGYAAYKTYGQLSDVIGLGMQMETLSVAEAVVGKNAGISAETLKYFTGEVRSAGIAAVETTQVLTKGMILGLDLNKMKDLATRARDIAVISGQNTSETVQTIMHGIESGMVRIFHTMGIAVRDQLTIYDEYAKSIGKSREEINQVERAQAMLNEVLRASAGYAGAAAAADATVGKQIASMKRYADDAYVSLWALFEPGMAAGVQTLTQGFKDLRTWADENHTTLDSLGYSAGEYAASAGKAALESAKWLASNVELIKSLAELYIISKGITWVQGFTTASALLTGVTQGLIPILTGATTATTAYTAGMYNAATGTMTWQATAYSATAAGAALNAMMVTLLPSIIAVCAALAVYGAHQTIKQPADWGGASPEERQLAGEAFGLSVKEPEKSPIGSREGSDYFTRPTDLTVAGKLSGKTWKDGFKSELTQDTGFTTELMARLDAGAAAELARQKSAPGRGKEGKGGRDTTETMENLILQMRQEQAKLTEGAFSANDAWYTKIENKIRTLAMDDKQLQEGLAVATELKVAKQRAAEEGFQNWLGKANNDTTVKIIDDGIKALNKWGNTEGRRKEISDAINKQLIEDHQKVEAARTQETKKYYDSLASASVLFADQYAWKEKSLALEIQLSQQELERWFVGKGLTDTEKNTYRQLEALTGQAKRYNLERQKAVDAGTLEGWAIERAGDALKRERASIKDMMAGLESFGADSLGQATQGILSQEQGKSAKEMGKTIVQSMALEMQKKSFTMVWDNIAKMLAPKTPSTLGTGGVGALRGSTGMGVSSISQITELQKQAAEGSVQAAQQLNEAAGAHEGAAGNLSGAAGLTGLSAAQTCLAAGGMLLAGIGVATGSQALIYASMVLEAAALLLQIAAAVDAIPFLHTGGMIAHTGLLVAHSGLALDERLILAQTGEGIIQRSAMAAYARAGISFDMLNSGRLPVLPMPGNFTTPARQSGAGSTHYNDNKQAHIHIGDLHIHAYDMTQQEAEKFVDRTIMPAINKKLGNRGLSMMD